MRVSGASEVMVRVEDGMFVEEMAMGMGGCGER